MRHLPCQLISSPAANTLAFPWIALIILSMSFVARAASGQPTTAPPSSARYFHIQVVDEETGRGIPLVELKTVNGIRQYTDSAGHLAFWEPDLMGQEVYFHVRSHGYEYPADGFGYRGVRLMLEPGKSTTIRMKRINLARRLYRITGAGIYRDTRLLGLQPPVETAELNAKLLGCDSVVNAIYRGRLYWFWGDTQRTSYPLGNFHVTGATSRLPDEIDPEAGVRLDYLTDQEGFVKEMAPLPGAGPTWIFGLFVTRDQQGEEKLVAKYEKIKPPLTPYQRGLVVFNDEKNEFEKLVEFPLGAPLYPAGQALIHRSGEQEFVYFARPFPLTRVENRFTTVQVPEAYEAWTCFRTGVRLDPAPDSAPQLRDSLLDRDRSGNLVFRWRKNTQPLTPQLERQLVEQGLMRKDEAVTLLTARADQASPPAREIVLSSGSVAWNEFRQKWILIGVEVGGRSMLGEIWFAEADRLVGPWSNATRIVTHDDYSFYNPRHHPYFDRQGGRQIFFEGTYTKMFSGTKTETPRYDYNQIMYQLDLSRIPTED